MSKISRAAVYARATWAAGAPVSSCARSTKAGPIRLMRLFVVAVAVISRRRRWRTISRAKRLRTAGGK
jgi:hypothetical protein